MMVRVAKSSAMALVVIAKVAAIQPADTPRMASSRNRSVGRSANIELSAVTTVSMPL